MGHGVERQDGPTLCSAVMVLLGMSLLDEMTNLSASTKLTTQQRITFIAELCYALSVSRDYSAGSPCILRGVRRICLNGSGSEQLSLQGSGRWGCTSSTVVQLPGEEAVPVQKP